MPLVKHGKLCTYGYLFPDLEIGAGLTKFPSQAALPNEEDLFHAFSHVGRGWDTIIPGETEFFENDVSLQVYLEKNKKIVPANEAFQ